MGKFDLRLASHFRRSGRAAEDAALTSPTASPLEESVPVPRPCLRILEHRYQTMNNLRKNSRRRNFNVTRKFSPHRCLADADPIFRLSITLRDFRRLIRGPSFGPVFSPKDPQVINGLNLCYCLRLGTFGYSGARQNREVANVCHTRGSNPDGPEVQLTANLHCLSAEYCCKAMARQNRDVANVCHTRGSNPDGPEVHLTANLHCVPLSP